MYDRDLFFCAYSANARGAHALACFEMAGEISQLSKENRASELQEAIEPHCSRLKPVLHVRMLPMRLTRLALRVL
jgi:hypothetical protein